ncbi:MAG: choice-of-anchor V domain-containing protein [Bacteroidota bacterium]
MKKTSLLIKLIIVLLLSSVTVDVFTNATNPPAGTTGGPSEGSCSTCHGSGNITLGANWSAITLTGIIGPGYIAGSTYIITVAGNAAATTKNGFEVTVLNGANNTAGTLASGTGSGLITSGGRTYVRQTSATQSSWSFTWTAPNPAVGAVTFYLAYNATNNNSSADIGDNVYIKAFTFTEASSNIPTAVITPSATTICLGDTLFLSGSGQNNPTTYNWQFLGNTPNAATGKNVFVVYTSTGIKTVRLTTSNNDGSSSPTNQNITVVAKPTSTITATNSAIVCDNDSVTLTGPTGSGLTYLWTPGNFTTPSIKAGNAGIYTLKVTNSNNCFSISTKATTKQAKPQSTLINNKDSVCTGDTILFDLTGNGFSAIYHINNIAQPNTGNGYLLGGNAGIYNVQPVISQNGCSTTIPTKTVKIIDPLPAVQNVICTATPNKIEFEWPAINGATGYQVSLNNGQSWINANNGLSHIIDSLNPNTSISLKIRGINDGPCAAGNEITKTCVNSPCPAIHFKTSFTHQTCRNGNQLNDSSVVVINNVDIANYLLKCVSGNDSIDYKKQNSWKFATKQGSNSIRLYIKDSLNPTCPAKIFDTTLMVYANPDKPILNNNLLDALICETKTFGIFLGNTNANKFAYYQVGNTNPLLFSSTKILPLQAKSQVITESFYVLAFDSLTGCAVQTDTLRVTTISYPKANFTFTINKGDVQFTNLSIAVPPTIYLWQFDDANHSSSYSMSPSFTYTQNNTYHVKLIANNNTCIDSITKQVTIAGLSINNITKNNISVYPNPITDDLHINLDGLLITDKLQIHDLAGKLVKEIAPEQKDLLLIPMDDLVKGVYIIKFNINEQAYQLKVIKG